MVSIQSNGGKVAYGIKNYIADTKADLDSLERRYLFPRSTAYVIDEEKYYILNNNLEWKDYYPYGKGGSGGGSDLPSHIIYDGGTI